MSLPPPIVGPSDDEQRRGLWARFQARPLWQRIAGGVAAVVVVAAAVSVAVEDDDATIETTVTTGSTIALTTGPAPTVETPAPDAPTFTTIVETTTSTTSTTTTTTTAPPATTVVPGSLLAVEVLDTIPIANETGDDYNRDLFGYPAVDSSGCDTRQQVLARASVIAPQTEPDDCTVIAGEWLSVYDGVTHTDQNAVQVEHVVALKEAWDSGANSWPTERLVAFANDFTDPRTLKVVTAEVNQDKGDADPSNWLPPDDTAICGHLGDWISIKARWQLTMDESEHGRIRNLLEDRCASLRIGPIPELPTITSPPPATDRACDASYPDACIPHPPPDLDCGDIPDRRFTVLPPDPHGFDGDNDGIGCES